MREATRITTIDGEEEVQWWDPEDFRNRTASITSRSGVHSLKIPDNSVVCDFCNDRITEYPVPVYRGSYALCTRCFEGIKV